MRFKIPAKELTKAMRLLLEAIEVKDIKSNYLKCVHITARSDGSLRLAMSNALVTAQYVTIDAEIIDPGIVMIKAETLYSVARKKIEQTIEISQVGIDRPKISRDTKFNVPYMTPEMFQPIPEIMCGGSELPLSIFTFLIERTLYSAAETNRFENLTDAVHIEYEAPHIIGVTTDSYRSPIVKYTYNFGDRSFQSVTIPRVACKAIAALSRTLEHEARKLAKVVDNDTSFISVDRVETIETDNKLHIKFGNLYISATKSVEEFPKWRTVLQDFSTYTKILVSPDDLRDTVDDLTTLKGTAVVFDASPGMLELSESSDEGDAVAQSIPAEVSGMVPNRCALNAKQLLQYLDSILKFSVVNEVEFYMPTKENFPVFFSYPFEQGRLDYVQGPTRIDR